MKLTPKLFFISCFYLVCIPVFSQKLDISKAFQVDGKDFELPYNTPQYIPLSKSDTFKIHFIQDLKMSDEFIYVSDYNYGGLVFKFDLDGQFLNVLGSEDTIQSENHFKFAISETDNELFTLNTDQNILSKYDITTNQEISTVVLPFNAIDFEYSSVSKRFVFYIPFNAQDDNISSSALIITDKSLNTIVSIPKNDLGENKDDICNPAYNLNISQRLHIDRQRNLILFSALYSGLISEISFEGSLVNQYIVVAPGGNEKQVREKLDQITLDGFELPMIDSIYLIKAFHETKDNVVVSSGYKNKTRNYIYDKHSGNLLESFSGVVINDRYSGAFNFYDLTPDYSNDDYFIKVYYPSTYNKVLSMILDKKRLENLPIIKDGDNPILVIYSYNNLPIER